MTKKHYEAIAANIRREVKFWREYDNESSGAAWFDSEPLCAVKALQVLAESLAATFGGDNPKFDRSRFLSACGII